MTHALDQTPTGIAPVRQDQRSLSTWDNFALWADLGISFLVMVVGMFLVPGLGFWPALLAIIVGAIIGNGLLGLAATIGSDTGLPTMVLLRGPLGIRGSFAPTVLNILQLLGWAALEVIVMSQVADALVTRFLGLPPLYPLWVALFSGLTVAMVLWGPIAVIKKWLARYLIWAMLLATLWVTVALALSYDLGTLLSQPGDGTMSFWLAVDLVVAMPISWFPLVADYSRFARGRKEAFWGTAAGYFVPHVWFYAIGAMLVLTATATADFDSPVAPIFASIAALGLGWLVLLVMLVGETDEGFANLYSTAVSVQNLLPGVSVRTTAIVGGVLILLIGWTVPLVQYESFLLLIGAAFIPLLGVLAADYFIVRGRTYPPEELLQASGRFWYTGGVNWPAIAVWLVGIASYLLIAGLPVAGWAGIAPWLGASIPSFAIAFVLHLIIGRLTAPAGQTLERTA